jgi:hypothetical protein
MSIISFKEFDVLNKSKVDDVMKFLNDDMRTSMAKHCYNWEQFDFRNYLLRSSIRYYIAYKSFYNFNGGGVK